MVSLLTAILPSFFNFLTGLPSILEGLGPQKTLIFIERVIIFEVFRIFHLNVIWGLFGWPLGPSWGLLGLLAAIWGPSWALWVPMAYCNTVQPTVPVGDVGPISMCFHLWVAACHVRRGVCFTCLWVAALLVHGFCVVCCG